MSSLTGLPSRRDVVRGLLAAGLGLSAARLPHGAVAKRRRRKKRTVRFNDFGCVDVGDYCKSDGDCCSNLCRERKCRAHDTGGCRPGAQDHSCSEIGTNVPCTSSAGNPDGLCDTTTGNGAYCAASGGCFACKKDADCLAVQGPGSACIHCAKCTQTGGTSCARP